MCQLPLEARELDTTRMRIPIDSAEAAGADLFVGHERMLTHCTQQLRLSLGAPTAAERDDLPRHCYRVIVA